MRDGELEEVERALSVLGGRHPDQVRAEREAAQAAARRQEEHAAMLASERARARRRFVMWVVVLVAASGLAMVAYRSHAARSTLDAEIAPQVAQYVKLGFDALARNTFAPENRAELSTVAGDCYVFVAARGAEMRIERPVGTTTAKGEALVCTCASENLVASTENNAPLRVLHISGPALGGTRALAYRFGDRTPTILAGDELCAEDALAGFARNKSYGVQESNGEWLALHPSLAAAGFITVASAPPRLPFVFVEGKASSCYLASSALPTDELTLLTLGDSSTAMQRPVHAKSTLAWCVVKPASFIVERAAAGPTAGRTTVVSVPSARIGGMLGLREQAARAKLTLATWARDDERGDLARETLLSSVVPDATAIGSQTIDATLAKDTRVVLFSVPVGSEGFSTNDLDFRCTPKLGEPEALCVQPHALTWRAPPPSVACGAAYGPLPYWMTLLGETRDPRTLDLELALMTLARHLAALEFFPGVIEGVTEKEDSVEILGRSGDDAIVALGLYRVPPFVQTYTNDASQWALDGEPQVIPLRAGTRISLPIPLHPPPPSARRTVVFRHATSR